MSTRVYVTELDSKPIELQGWYNSIPLGVEAARSSVTAANEPLFVAVTGDSRVIHRIAHEDHPEAALADEIVWK